MQGIRVLGGFGRGFQFSFLGILILGILFPGIVFPGMCILVPLVDGLNFSGKFYSFPKIPLAVQHPATVGGGLVVVGGGRWWDGGGPAVAQRWRVAAEVNQWWVAIRIIWSFHM